MCAEALEGCTCLLPVARTRHIAATHPDEVYFAHAPAHEQPRFETRSRWPRGSPCAEPQADFKGPSGDRIIIEIDYVANRHHSPFSRARHAA
jgi:hypothetical protein